jgi:carbon monoxide dehydrogenase subunit G
VKIQGSHRLDATRAAVFAAICDPNTLLAVIPGCREVERVSENEYVGRISLRLPGFVGSYRTRVRLAESDPPRCARLEGEVVGAPGSVRGRASFRLEEADGGTQLTYDGAAVISGPLARLDGRFAEGLTGSLISQGLRALNARLERAAERIEDSA